MTQTIADLLPPRVRAWVYALLLPVNAGFVPVLVSAPRPVVITYGIANAMLNAAGFTLARANTPTTPNNGG
mgnify:FL=1